MVDLYWFSLLVPTKSRLFLITQKEIHRIHYWNYLPEHGAAVPTSMKSVLDFSGGGPLQANKLIILDGSDGSCLFYRFCCSAVSRWSRSSASNRICCVNERNSYKAQVSHKMLFNNMLKSFKIIFLTKGVVKNYIVPSSSISLIKEWVPLVYLDEPVSPLQVVHQFLLLCLPVLPAAQPDSFRLPPLLLSLPQLQPCVSQFSCQRTHYLTVTFLLMLVKKSKRLLLHGVSEGSLPLPRPSRQLNIWRCWNSSLLPELCQPNKYVWKLNSHCNAVISPAP